MSSHQTKQISELINSLPSDSDTSLGETNDFIQKVINTVKSDDDSLRRVLSLYLFSELSCNELAQQDLTDIERRLSEEIKSKIVNQQKMIEEKKKELDFLIKASQKLLSGLKQHEVIVKATTEAIENLKTDTNINELFAGIESSIAIIEGKIKNVIDERRNTPVENLNYL